jgi:two-component system, NarL family, response regulator
MTNTIRVLVVEDQPAMRVGLTTIVGAGADMEVVAEAGDGAQAVEAFSRHRPDVTLMDLGLPGSLDGHGAIAAIRAMDPTAAILVLTTLGNDSHVHRALNAGALGYLLKDSDAETITRAIRTVNGGKPAIASGVAATLASSHDLRALSPREIEVLELVAKGLNTAEIGGVLSISEPTVKTHLKHVFEKLEVDNRAEAVAVAIQRGMVTLG